MSQSPRETIIYRVHSGKITVYIGRTDRTLITRRHEHERAACKEKKPTRFHIYLRDNGAPEWEVLAVYHIASEDIVTRRLFEQRWIDKYKPQCNSRCEISIKKRQDIGNLNPKCRDNNERKEAESRRKKKQQSEKEKKQQKDRDARAAAAAARKLIEWTIRCQKICKEKKRTDRIKRVEAREAKKGHS